ncbi:MAG: S-methyl-5'-thioinosine phosphorylase [Candidatus Competibacterales bacterium]
MPAPIAIIGGTGLTSLSTLTLTRREMVPTPFGEPSGPLVHGELQGCPVVFLPRHGAHHTIPPHKINYRANLWALKHIGVTRVIAVAAVGGIREDMAPGVIAFPDQIIDYTFGRAHTFFEQDLEEVVHVDFTWPYSSALRQALIHAARTCDLKARESATYGATQGPRLETAAEIRRLARDGCDVVGMTGMPEAALARELALEYATCAVVANWGAGITDGEITMAEIQRHLADGMAKVKGLLNALMPALAAG